jgi:hypothetical protein
MEKELAKEREARAATQRKPDLSNAARQADGNIGVLRVVREIEGVPSLIYFAKLAAFHLEAVLEATKGRALHD